MILLRELAVISWLLLAALVQLVRLYPLRLLAVMGLVALNFYFGWRFCDAMRDYRAEQAASLRLELADRRSELQALRIRCAATEATNRAAHDLLQPTPNP
jgi:hypothetical protein